MPVVVVSPVVFGPVVVEGPVVVDGPVYKIKNEVVFIGTDIECDY